MNLLTHLFCYARELFLVVVVKSWEWLTWTQQISPLIGIFHVINFIIFHLQDAVPHLVGDEEGAALLGDVGYVFQDLYHLKFTLYFYAGKSTTEDACRRTPWQVRRTSWWSTRRLLSCLQLNTNWNTCLFKDLWLNNFWNVINESLKSTLIHK